MAELHPKDSPPPRGVRAPKHLKTTTKQDLIDRVAEQMHQPRSRVKRLIHCLMRNMIIDLQAGNRIELRAFGVFEVKQRAARVAQNPKTLEPIAVPPRRTVKFKLGRLMKSALEGDGHIVFTMDDFDDEDDDMLDDDVIDGGARRNSSSPS